MTYCNMTFAFKLNWSTSDTAFMCKKRKSTCNKNIFTRILHHETSALDQIKSFQIFNMLPTP